MRTDEKSVWPTIAYLKKTVFGLVLAGGLSGNAVAAIPYADPPGQVGIIAGGVGEVAGSPALTFSFESYSVALDTDSQDRIYFENHGYIRRTETDGTISIFRQGLYGGYFSGVNDFYIQGDFLYYIDYGTAIYRVDLRTDETQEITPPGLAGESSSQIAVDSNQNIYLQSSYSSVIYRVQAGTGEVSLFAGRESDCDEFCAPYSNGVPATEADIGGGDMTVDPGDDSLLLGEYFYNRISRIDTQSGTIQLVADASDEIFVDPYSGTEGIMSIDVLPGGDILITDGSRHVWRVAPETGVLSVLAGNGVSATAGDGKGLLEASLQPDQLAVDSEGNFLVTSNVRTRGGEQNVGQRVRYVDLQNDRVTSVIGAPGALACQSPTESLIFNASSVVAGDDGTVYMHANEAILAIDPRLDVMYTVAGQYGTKGVSADGSKAFGNPISAEGRDLMAIAPNGDIYFAEANRLRRVNRETGLLETVTEGPFRFIQFTGDGKLFAIKQEYDFSYDYVYSGPPEIVEIDTVTGTQTVRISVDELYGIFDSWGMGNPDWDLLDFAVSSGNDIYMLTPTAVLVMNADREVSIAFGSDEQIEYNFTVDYFGYSSLLTLDENSGIIYISDVWAASGGEYQQIPVLRYELATARVDNYATGFVNMPDLEELVEFPASPWTMAVDSDGSVFLVGYSDGDESQYLWRIAPPSSGAINTDDIGAGSNIGGAVAQMDNWMAVGVPNHPTSGDSSGQVLVYRDNDCRPILQDRLETPAGSRSKGFGNALAFAGDRLVVGSREASSQGDSFRLGTYRITGDELLFERDLSDRVSAEGELTGNSLASSGVRFAVGVPAARGGAGEVVVFNTGNLDSSSYLTSSGTGFSEFGRSLALNNGLLAIGSRDAGASGTVELFEQTSSSYVLKTNYPSRDGKIDFGASLAMDDNSLYVGAPDASGGKVYRYRINSDNDDPTLVSTIGEGGGASRSSFGSSLRLALGVLFVGEPDSVVTVSQRMQKGGQRLQNTSANSTGKVHLYRVENRTGEVLDGASLFSVTASSEEHFGASLDVNNGRLLVGAPGTNDGRGDFDSVSEMVDPSLLSGLWFDPALDGEGYNVLVAKSGLVVFYYGYTADGQRLWLLSDVIPHGFRFGENINVKVFKATAGDFQSPVPSQSALVDYGLLSIAFGSTRSATFTLTGFDGAKVSRSVFLADTEANAAAYSGLWFDPQDDGEGYNVISGKSGTVIYYYGSSSDGERLWLISDLLDSEIDDGTTLRGTVYEAEGGDFLHPLASSEALRTWGTIEARFDDCGNGRFVLDGTDGMKSSNVIKLAGVSGAVCDQ